MPEKKERGPIERFLSVFSDIRGGEGANVLLMFANIFLILTAYYVLKVVRESLTIGGVELFGLGGDEIKAYLPAVMTVLLLGLLSFSGSVGVETIEPSIFAWVEELPVPEIETIESASTTAIEFSEEQNSPASAVFSQSSLVATVEPSINQELLSTPDEMNLSSTELAEYRFFVLNARKNPGPKSSASRLCTVGLPRYTATALLPCWC